MVNEDALYAHLWLMCPGIGQRRLAVLRRTFGTFRIAWYESDSILEQWGKELFRGTGNKMKQVLEFKQRLSVEEQYQSLCNARIWILLITSSDYPKELLHLANPPELLYGRGQLILEKPRLSIVGTRHPSSYGTFVAGRLASELAAAGVEVVSGLARGIDTSAHIGALKAGGTTTAILGSGVSSVYPEENQALAKKIESQGSIVSEVLPTTIPTPGLFPQRNRIIAALSQAVLVVEAGLKSGAMSTVDAALGMGREVFAVPGPIYEVGSQGPNRLIQEGAKLVTSVEDIVAELPGLKTTGPNVLGTNLPQCIQGSTDMCQIWECLAGGSVHISSLVITLKIHTDLLLQLLLEMVMQGIVESLPGGYWSRKLESILKDKKV